MMMGTLREPPIQFLHLHYGQQPQDGRGFNWFPNKAFALIITRLILSNVCQWRQKMRNYITEATEIKNWSEEGKKT